MDSFNEIKLTASEAARRFLFFFLYFFVCFARGIEVKTPPPHGMSFSCIVEVGPVFRKPCLH